MTDLDSWFGPRSEGVEGSHKVEHVDVDIEKWVSMLPDPEVDERPPYVGLSDEDKRKAEEDEAYEAQFLDVAKDTERLAKYVLTKHFGCKLRKDGDWITTVSGQEVWQKKTADYRGSIALPGLSYNPSLFVEVKGISPEKLFQLARLDRRNNPNQKSQHEKLNDAYIYGDMVWLVLGWWFARIGSQPVMEERKGRIYTRWRTEDVYLSLDVIQWKDWLMFLEGLKRRSLRLNERAMLRPCTVEKNDSGRWELCPNHWFRNWRLP